VNRCKAVKVGADGVMIVIAFVRVADIANGGYRLSRHFEPLATSDGTRPAFRDMFTTR